MFSKRYLSALSNVLVMVVLALFSQQVLAVSDPTKPFSYKAVSKAKPTYTLNSILISDARKIAVINGKAYAEGEKSPLGTLAEITANQVVINGKGRHVLTLGTKAIRQ